jgi:hypothetical protein
MKGVEIKVVINNYREFCGGCNFQERSILSDSGWHCTCYRKPLTANKDGAFLRVSECVAAEVELIGLREAWDIIKQWDKDVDCNTCPLAAYEACDELCESKAALIQKVAELFAELERGELIWENLPKTYGDLMTVSNFREQLASGCFIESDGSGNYAMSDKVSNKEIDFNLHQFDEDVAAHGFTHVVWFNK